MPTLITLAAPAVAAALALSPLAGLTSGDGDASPVASGVDIASVDLLFL